MTIALWLPGSAAYKHLAWDQIALPGDAVSCTADLETLWLARREQRPVRSLWSLVAPEDQISAAREARELADTWTATLEAVQYQGVHLGALCHTSLLYSFRDVLFAQRMASRFLDEVRPSRLLIPNIGGTPPNAQAAAWLWEAARRTIEVERLSLDQPPPDGSQTRSAGRLRRGLGRLRDTLGWQVRVRGRGRGEQGRVAFFGGGADLVNQRAVIERLRATRPYDVLQFSLDPAQASATSRSQPSGELDAMTLLPYPSPRHYRELHSLGQAAWAVFQQTHAAGSTAEPHGVIFANTALRPMFRTFFLDTLPRTGGMLGVAGQVLDAFRPQLVVLNNDTGGRARAIVAAARLRSIPTAQLIHSGFNDLDFRRFATDRMWVWGNVHRRQLTALGLPAEHIDVTGNPNFDYLAKQTAGDLPARVRAATRSQLGLARDDVVLLLITAKPPYLLTFVDQEQHGEDLEALCQAIDALPHARLVVKPHPRYDDTVVYRFLAERHPSVALVEGMLLDQLLPACDVALMINVASTGGIEALALGKPLVWLRPSVRYPEHASVFESVALTVDSRDDIAATIDRLARSEDHRIEVAAMGQAHLPDLLAHLDATATDAVVAAIDAIVSQQEAHERSAHLSHRQSQ